MHTQCDKLQLDMNLLLHPATLIQVNKWLRQVTYCHKAMQRRQLALGTEPIDRVLEAYWAGDTGKIDELLGKIAPIPRYCKTIGKAKRLGRYSVRPQDRARIAKSQGLTPKDIHILDTPTTQECAESRIETESLVKNVTRGGVGRKTSDDE